MLLVFLSSYYSQYISSILFITSTCFGPIQVHHQEKNYIYVTLGILLFCIASCLVCRILHTRQNIVHQVGFIYKLIRVI